MAKRRLRTAGALTPSPSGRGQGRGRALGQFGAAFKNTPLSLIRPSATFSRWEKEQKRQALGQAATSIGHKKTPRAILAGAC
ncbi:MAG: hypothetical protein H8E20_15710 [Verrucomicrobia bacterium]|nr:hypothetical protein [Verrucomicrobiota bacterium]